MGIFIGDELKRTFDKLLLRFINDKENFIKTAGSIIRAFRKKIDHTAEVEIHNSAKNRIVLDVDKSIHI